MILLRHGESEFNVVYGRTRRDPGITDPVLTADGHRQAAAAVGRLRAAGPRRIIASPYTRALQTAEVLADGLGLSVTVEPLVRERRAFVCDIGSRRSELALRWPALDFSHLDEQWWPDTEESETVLAARCARFRTRMADLGDWAGLLVVSHWGFIRQLTGQTLANAEMIQFDPT